MISKARYIENTESLTEDLPLIKYENPDYIYLALTNARCNKGEVYVKEGDYINNTTKNLKKIAMLTIASPNISELLYIVQQLNINFDILSEDGHSLIYERCSVNDFDTFVNYYKLI